MSGVELDENNPEHIEAMLRAWDEADDQTTLGEIRARARQLLDPAACSGALHVPERREVLVCRLAAGHEGAHNNWRGTSWWPEEDDAP